MKIKNKLIAGGLMSVVACALVGSITGTFAWYQYSTKATVSMHGVSVGTTRNLELSFDEFATDPLTGNITWESIKTHLTKGTVDASAANSGVKLSPVSNGVLTATSTLNETWYGNPDGTDSLPVVTEGYLQFSFAARIHENDGTTDSYPAGKLYVTDIAGRVVDATSELSGTANQNLAKALRMHVAMGSTCFLVNPTNSASESVTLSATIDYQKQYDWESAAATAKTYQIPATGTAGTVVTSSHASVKPSSTDANGNFVGGIYGTLPGTAAGLTVTVTLWLEGFTELDNQGANNDQTTDWWDFSANIDDLIYAGFELTGIKG